MFWQLLSYLLSLLAHNLTHAATLEGAFRTFTFLRVGDVAFLAGIVLAHSLYGTIEFHELFARAADNPIIALALSRSGDQRSHGGHALNFYRGHEQVGPVSASRLASVPCMRRPRSMRCSMRASSMRAASLMNRLAPLYGLSPITLHVAFVIGTLTAILGASMMLTQNDIKKTLGFSTIGQMGYMIMECGLGAFALAVFHLIAHGLFKATVFLNCGNVIHKARQEPRFLRGRPPKNAQFSRLAWSTGFFTTLLMPLMILLVAHGILQFRFAIRKAR